MRIVLALVAPLVLAAGPVFAQSAAPCADPGYRAFDFWVGEWRVTRPDGQVAGRNVIDQTLGGCALRERWEGAGGMTGTSLNTYDPTSGAWHQTWIDDRGGFLLLTGGREGDAMVLTGETRDDEGTLRHRITWTPDDRGRVRQVWETSRDDGATWTVVFDGLYAPE